MYGCGLRISEATGLQIRSIRSAQMVLDLIGKGSKQRLVPLPGALLEPMRDFWKTHRHPIWLFPSKTGRHPLSKQVASKAFRRAREAAGFDDRFVPHTLRHSYATRLIERGTPLPVVKDLLGHGSIRTTEIYTHMTTPLRDDVQATVNGLFAGLA